VLGIRPTLERISVQIIQIQFITQFIQDSFLWWGIRPTPRPRSGRNKRRVL